MTVVQQHDEDRTDEMRAAVATIQNATVDAITNTGALTMLPNEAWQERAPVEDRVIVAAQTPQGTARIRVLRGAHDQIAEKMQIPGRYYRRMMTTQPELLSENVNTWMRAEPANRLVRMLRPITDDDGERFAQYGVQLAARAFLSDCYRPIDNAALLDQVLPVAQRHGGRVAEFNVSERHFHVRLVTQPQDVQEVVARVKAERPDLGAHFMGLHEVISTGIAIRNSETGHGAYSSQALTEIMRCTNMLVTTERQRIIHRGGRTNEEEAYFQTDTRRLDDAATFLKIRDHAIQIFSPAEVEKMALAVAEAQGRVIEIPSEIPLMNFVESVGKRFDLGEQETKVLQDEFMSELPQSGVMQNGKLLPTRWTLSQAMTASAKRLAEGNGEPGCDWDHKRDIEEHGWRVLNDPIGNLLKAATTN